MHQERAKKAELWTDIQMLGFGAAQLIRFEWEEHWMERSLQMEELKFVYRFTVGH